MKIRLLYTLLVAALVAVAAVGLGSLPANAQLETVQVRLDNGEIVEVQVDVPPGTPLEDIEIPTVPDVTEPDDDGGGSGGSGGGTTDPTDTGTPESTDQEEQEPSETRDGTQNAGDETTREETTLDLEVRSRARATGSGKPATTSATPMGRPPARTRPSSTRSPARPESPVSRTSSSASSRSRSSCSRSTRPPASSTGSTGRCSPPSTRSRPTTAAT
jgi:hypothetical protein